MKAGLLFLGALLTAINVYSQVGIGTTTPSPAAMLEVSSTSDAGITYRGLMPPRVPNEDKRDEIGATAFDIGLLVFVEVGIILSVSDSITLLNPSSLPGST